MGSVVHKSIEQNAWFLVRFKIFVFILEKMLLFVLR